MSFSEELSQKFLEAVIPAIMDWAIDTVIEDWQQFLFLLFVLLVVIPFRERIRAFLKNEYYY